MCSLLVYRNITEFWMLILSMLVYIFRAINFTLATALAACHESWYAVDSFSFSSACFLFLLRFPLWLTDYLEICCLVSMFWWYLCYPPIFDFWFDPIAVREPGLHDFNSFRFYILGYGITWCMFLGCLKIMFSVILGKVF